MKTFFLALALVAFSMNSLAQEAFSTLEERMTGKEFKETGLTKLSDEELTALNNWLRKHSVATLESASGPDTDTRGFEIQAMQEMDDSTITSRIVGSFNGWKGDDTIFQLENGMIWKQNETSTFSIPAVENPVVTIKSGMFNSWRLSVEGYNRTVKVKRIQ